MGALVRRRDRDRFLTALFAPAGRRAALLAIYGFNYEVAKTREMVRETALGRMRLQWWRDSIAAIYEGGPVRHHQVVAPLAAAIAAHGLSRAHFDAIIEAREADLDDLPPPDLDALEAYAEASAGRLVLLALEALG
ncbi:MAG: squalene/phytoene synthase family protein, partial [Caulobacteraceae bacterium]